MPDFGKGGSPRSRPDRDARTLHFESSCCPPYENHVGWGTHSLGWQKEKNEESVMHPRELSEQKGGPPAKGWGLTTKSGFGTFGTMLGQSVPGTLEPDDPFSSPGKYKSGYSCTNVSKDRCVEKCVNDNFKPPYPNYQLGKYQCNDWADDVLRKCTLACGRGR